MLKPPGRRERNKALKERRIREAARNVFTAKGYEATTLREVAKTADVGFGTVFSYAQDKAGLLAMVYVQELKALPPLFDGKTRDTLLDELIAALAHLYRFWSTIPALSSHVLQQMEFFAGNPHMDIIVARRQQARSELADWLVQSQADGRIHADVDPGLAADTLFAIYTSAIREWSALYPNSVEAGLERLRALMALAIRGLAEPTAQ